MLQLQLQQCIVVISIAIAIKYIYKNFFSVHFTLTLLNTLALLNVDRESSINTIIAYR